AAQDWRPHRRAVPTVDWSAGRAGRASHRASSADPANFAVPWVWAVSWSCLLNARAAGAVPARRLQPPAQDVPFRGAGARIRMTSLPPSDFKARRGGVLDGLRFIAAAFIVLYHFAPNAPVDLTAVYPVLDRG